MNRVLFCGLSLALLLAACGGGDETTGDADASVPEGLEGSIRIDGSSTVYPITEAVAEEFRNSAPKVKVSIGVSGTGGGFKKFVISETDINDASRPIKGKEASKADEAGIEYIELPVAFDGLSVVVNKENDFVDHMTVDELNKIWNKDSAIKTWSDVRAEWPNREIKFYAPGVDSGTFDYFTDTINGDSGNMRGDFSASEDDNVLVTGIAGDKDAIGFFGFAYFDQNRDKLKVVPIDDGNGPVAPTMETINNGTYTPLSRPIFIYVAKKAAERPEVEAFVNFYLKIAGKMAEDVGYVALPNDIYDLAKERFKNRTNGSVFGKNSEGKGLKELMAQ